MKLFIEYILDELEQIGLNNNYRVSLSSSTNEENYVRGVMQYFNGSEKKEKKTDIIKEKALKEIKINLTEG
ncbi:hypothetical protein B5V90_18975, partial [Heyndrickxia sporothermodurans]